jgi:hypothetical protein
MMLKLTISAVTLSLVAFAGAVGDRSVQQSYAPRDGFVPDALTAVRIAEAVLQPVYGRELIGRQRPLIARLEGNVWVVEGTLPRGATLGGVAEVRIAKSNAAILHMSHGK